jgi:hypothetical protein
MDDKTEEIVYFRYCGEVNTEALLNLARKRSEKLGIQKVVIASETGRSALSALNIYRSAGIQLIVVTHPPAVTWGPRGDIPIGLKRKDYAETLKTLEENGVIIVQGTRPFAPPSRMIKWEYPTPEAMVDKTLELFGAGTKIAVEVSIIAADSGAVADGEEIISCAGTFKGLDTALVVRAASSMSFFQDFEIHEIIARPRCRVRKLPEYEFENWKGDLEKYYSTFPRDENSNR